MKAISRRWKMIAGLCGALLLGGAAGSVQAGICSYNPGTSQATYLFNVPPTIALTGAEAPGTVLWTSSPVSGDRVAYINCPGGAGSAGLIDIWAHTTTSFAGGYNIMNTNVPGVGFAISYSLSFGTGVTGYPSNPDGPAPNNNGNTATATLRFIKTSDAYFPGTSASINTSGDLTTWYVGTNKVRFAHFDVSSGTTFTKPAGGGGGGGGVGATCTITTSSSIALGSFVSSAFPTVGSSSPSKPVNISLACNRNLTSITVSLSPANSFEGDACNGVMKTSPGTGAATGIGIKMTDAAPGRRNVCWNQAIAYRYQNTSGQNYAVTFHASMVRVGAVVTPGAVAGLVIATVAYQ